MKFPDLLALFKTSPKTLDQAKATIGAAQPALDSVAAMFAAAGLDLAVMLEAGPDSLKAHLEGLTAKDGELAKAQSKIGELELELNTKASALATANETATANANALTGFYTAIGFKPEANADVKTAFKDHVTAEAALVLAKDGRPPVGHQVTPPPGGSAAIDPKLTGLAKVEAALKAKQKAKTVNAK